MTNAEIWDSRAAAAYDTPGTGMFAPQVLGPCVARLAELARGGRALEFAIGTGRVALPLLAAGVPVAGIEIAPAMLARLREKVSQADLPVVLGDMVSARVAGEYTLVFLVFNGLSNVLTQADQVAIFRNAARHLAPGGRFVVELWVPQLPHRGGPQVVVGTALPGYLQVDTCDTAAQVVMSHHVRMDDSTAAQVFRTPHRYVWPSEMDLMAQLAGFTLETRHSDWQGAEFDGASAGHVSVYRLGER